MIQIIQIMTMIKLFFLHFLADFILQPREMGKKKSSDFRWLFGHLAIQFLVFLPFVGWRLSAMNALVHGLIDKNIWNLYKVSVLYRVFPKSMPWKERPGNLSANYRYWEDHWFYVTIGLDQFLHAVTLIYLFG